MSARADTPVRSAQRSGARIVDFAGWDMPVQYPTGIVEEHLATRAACGLFDVSHMGRFAVRGSDAAAFLDTALTNDARSLAVGKAQYTLLPTETGGALDDAFLYRVAPEEYLLVVNAGNRERDWARLAADAARFPGAVLEDRSEALAMLSVQGPRSPDVLASALGRPLPEALRASARNTVWHIEVAGLPVVAVRTGYAGEPLGFELMVPAASAGVVWDLIVSSGALPVGLGARDTLRLEAGLPLYGHELGMDAEGKEIPILACPQARGSVCLAPGKALLCGAPSLAAQKVAWARIKAGSRGGESALPRLVRQMTLIDPGVARAGSRVLDASGDRHLGWVTSGTVVPSWIFEGEGGSARPSRESEKRSALLGLLDSSIGVGERVGVEVRGRLLAAVVVPRLLDARIPPYARPVTYRG